MWLWVGADCARAGSRTPVVKCAVRRLLYANPVPPREASTRIRAVRWWSTPTIQSLHPPVRPGLWPCPWWGPTPG